MHSPSVCDLKLKRKSRLLEIGFDDGSSFQLSCEYLRVYSPSAEVQGHGTPKLVTHKKDVNISAIEPVGNYGVKLIFDDGHDTGLYSWVLLHQLATHRAELWQDYLNRLQAEKASREPLLAVRVSYR